MKVKLLTSINIVYNGDQVFMPRGLPGKVLSASGSGVRVQFAFAFRQFSKREGDSGPGTVEIDVDASNLEWGGL